MGEESNAPLLVSRGGDEASIHDAGLGRRFMAESKLLWRIVGPAILSRLASYSYNVITQAFAGHLGDTEFAAISILISVITGFDFGLLLGMASALETLCGQAYGARQYHMLGIYMQRSWIVLIGVCIILLPLYLFAGPLLLLLGQPREVAELAGQLAFWLIPLHFAFAFIFPLQRFLQCQLKNAVYLWSALAGLVVHVVVNWLFVRVWGLGAVGATATLNISWWVFIFGMLFYTTCGGCPGTWNGVSMEAFSGLWDFLKLSASSGVMLCLENWYYRILVLMTGNKRLSVGFRPLPPDDINESEDPEYRANRIRSFYKEYFGESEEAPPPMPPMPPMPQGGRAGGPQYYEDYDQGYMGGAAAPYFDPETNAFVMPYAQPVTRRAMTPPPAGRRPGPGPGRPVPRPRGPNGSIGGMSFHSGPGGRSRAGSALGPRPDSSASARMRQPPMKRMPPPAPLATLPTPSKLRDDNSFLINAADFAPPSNIRDTAAGRSQSPFGERRPYSPSVPAAQTLVSPFEELAALPSPHLLRKSGTFTGLDFAPPKKFKDSDNMSDAGSIRSNRSGMSQAQLGAIRNGAGRVSRLPGDQVFTADALQDTLKPSWGIRP